VFGNNVVVEVKDKDRYGRTVGRVSVGDLAVNVELVRRGFAWWYRDYAKKDVELATAEADAKNHKRGLWAEKDPIPLWEFRRNASKAKAVPSGT
jgi:endonuclease YncB( thermonuclease family)